MTEASQLILEFDHRPSLSGDDFLVAPNNADAVGWIDKWPDWPTTVLNVVGPPGCGKSHLSAVLRSKIDVDLLPIEQLSEPYQPTSSRTIIIEDVDLLLTEVHEEGLFHLINDLKDQGGYLLLNSISPPSRWTVKLADLRSRLMAANVVEITPPDDNLIAAVLVKLFQDRQLRISDDVIAYAVRRMERSFATARRLVETADRTALSEKKPITVPLIKRVLKLFEHEGEPSWT